MWGVKRGNGGSLGETDRMLFTGGGKTASAKIAAMSNGCKWYCVASRLSIGCSSLSSSSRVRLLRWIVGNIETFLTSTLLNELSYKLQGKESKFICGKYDSSKLLKIHTYSEGVYPWLQALGIHLHLGYPETLTLSVVTLLTCRTFTFMQRMGGIPLIAHSFFAFTHAVGYSRRKLAYVRHFRCLVPAKLEPKAVAFFEAHVFLLTWSFFRPVIFPVRNAQQFCFARFLWSYLKSC